MADDVETLRLRAKAKAKAARDRGVDNGVTISAPPTPAQRINQAASAYQEPFNKSIEQFKSGNYPAAVLNLGNTAMQAIGTPFNLASEGWRNVPVVGGLVSGAINAIPNLTNSLYGLLQSGANKGLSAVGYTPEFERNLLGISPKTQEETSSALQNFGGGASQFLAAPIIGKGFIKAGEAIPKLGQSIENLGTASAQRAFKAGETQPEIQAFGKFAQQYGARLSKKGFNDLSNFTKRLNAELNQKIIDPATKSGALIEGDNVLNAMRGLYEEEIGKMSPSTTRLSAIDKMIRETEARLQKTEVPGKLTPREAQDMMVQNNKELGKLYEKEKSMQGLTGDENTRKLQLKLGNDQLRGELEQIHPEVKNIKWTEKAGIAVSRMMDEYIKSKMKGEEAPHATLRAGLKGMAGITIYDLLRLRPFMARLGSALGKTGRLISGEETSFATGVNRPFQPPPRSTGIVPPFNPLGGNPVGGVDGSPRNGTPFTPTPQDATYVDIRGNLLPPRQQARLQEPPLQSYDKTTPAVEAGRKLTPEVARRYLDLYRKNNRDFMREFDTASKQRQLQLGKIIQTNQYNREVVEGFIAQRLGTEHIPYAKGNSLEEMFAKAVKK